MFLKLSFDDISIFKCWGVDNGAAGAAAAAPIIWLVVVNGLFGVPHKFYLARSVNVSVGLLGRDHNGLVRYMCHKHGLGIWQSPVDYFIILLCNDCPDDQCLY